MTQDARGSFTVDIRPLLPAPADGIQRLSINKTIEGDLNGTTRGEMYTGGDPKKGMAGYVAIEVFQGTLAGKSGSFALQHFATMDADGPHMQVIVVPGSGSGDLAGISGTLKIKIEAGRHDYELSYSLP